MPSLDGWRAIAILLVLISHTPYTLGAPAVLWGLLPLGDLGVRIFFVLSGFLITYLLLAEHEERGAINLRHFYVRRILRIFPVYFLYLFALLFLQVTGRYDDNLTSWIGAFTFTRNYLGHGDSATAHFWSLAIEEQFYLIWPTILALAHLSKHHRLALALLSLVIFVGLLARTIECNDVGFLCQRVLGGRSDLRYADSLGTGCLGAFVLIRWRSKVVGRNGSALFYASLSLLVLSAMPPGVFHAAMPTSLSVTLQGFLIVTCIILSTAGRPVLAYGALNSWLLVRIGLLSYSLYVWHFLFLSSMMGERFAQFIIHDWRIWWGATLLTAFISFNFVEMPIAALKARFGQDLHNLRREGGVAPPLSASA